MAKWKRPAVAAFVEVEGYRAVFCRTMAEAVAGARGGKGDILVWASRSTPHLVAACSAAGIPLLFMEDGFLRSKGLGSRRVPPASLVVDRQGIYYDATRPSDLEDLLQRGEIPADRVEQASALRQLIVAHGLSKYNVGRKQGSLDAPRGRRVLLVVGQVADDASIRLGTGPIASNLDLLRQVRLDNPASYIVYKPHPDVEQGRRRGWIAPHVALRHADHIVTDLAPEIAIEQVHEVCVMTSLLGFEALLRGKPVRCYGMPFYAGWGITSDTMTNPRRGRGRTIEEVLAAAYLIYARYVDPDTLQPVDAFAVARAMIG
jgi:capsular polysaccharide export protein